MSHTSAARLPTLQRQNPPTFTAQQHKEITKQSLPNLPVEKRGTPRSLSHIFAPWSPTGSTVGPCSFPGVFSSIFEPERFSCRMVSCECTVEVSSASSTVRQLRLLDGVLVGRGFCELPCR